MSDEHELGSEEAAITPALRQRRMVPPSELAEHERRRQRLILMAVRAIFLALMVTVPMLPFVGSLTRWEQEDFTFWDYIVPVMGTFLFGAVVLLIDAATPNKKLASVFGIYLGIIAGLIGALAIGALLDLVARSWDLATSKTQLAYLSLIKLAISIAVCYLAVSIVLMTKDDFRLVIPYVEFAKQMRGVRPLLLDTSVLIDGRIDNLGQTGFLDAPLVVPLFVIEELQALADSSDKLKRARGRRGLGVVTKLQTSPKIDVSIDNATEIPRRSVDHMLLQLAAEQNLRILTTDYNLNKVAEIHGVTVLNLNDLTTTLKSQAIPGETLVVEVVKPGEGANQGVGYMPDGTMVVIEDARNHVGQTVSLVVTNSLQTAAGRMIFGTLKDVSVTDGHLSHAGQMAKAATNQPRTPVRVAKIEEPAAPAIEPRRNPRR
ncbi:MAG: PIN domain-containing protein [Phycisphaerales bacterium]|nr:PIN domain-containing protein [Phycisphaerales bacterium]MCI0630332.1 PIN domain-containing protein [Phycisphaerales bacterium]MCI0676216.1 PIN domain-containing protein [Phycisphaerales bacterium]